MSAITLVNQQISKMASMFNLPDSNELANVLKKTAFKGDKEVTDEQMSALLIVANQYKLNPWTKEIYAFPDKRGGIVPVVGLDGWARIINEHPMFDGMEFEEGDVSENLPGWIECRIFRKDRSRATAVREYFVECKRPTDPWRSHPRRMLRHKAMIQCARLAFGFTGFYDEDEAARIMDIDGDGNVVQPGSQSAGASMMPKARSSKPKQDAAVAHPTDSERTIDVEAKEVKEASAPAATSAPAAAAAAAAAPAAQPAAQQQVDGDAPKLTDGMLTIVRKKLADGGKDEESFTEKFGFDLAAAPRARINEFLTWASA